MFFNRNIIFENVYHTPKDVLYHAIVICTWSILIDKLLCSIDSFKIFKRIILKFNNKNSTIFQKKHWLESSSLLLENIWLYYVLWRYYLSVFLLNLIVLTFGTQNTVCYNKRLENLIKTFFIWYLLVFSLNIIYTYAPPQKYFCFSWNKKCISILQFLLSKKNVRW